MKLHAFVLHNVSAFIDTPGRLQEAADALVGQPKSPEGVTQATRLVFNADRLLYGPMVPNPEGPVPSHVHSGVSSLTESEKAQVHDTKLRVGRWAYNLPETMK